MQSSSHSYQKHQNIKNMTASIITRPQNSQNPTDLQDALPQAGVPCTHGEEKKLAWGRNQSPLTKFFALQSMGMAENYWIEKV
jgi:hypothetical protein